MFPINVVFTHPIEEDFVFDRIEAELVAAGMDEGEARSFIKDNNLQWMFDPGRVASTIRIEESGSFCVESLVYNGLLEAHWMYGYTKEKYILNDCFPGFRPVKCSRSVDIARNLADKDLLGHWIVDAWEIIGKVWSRKITRNPDGLVMYQVIFKVDND